MQLSAARSRGLAAAGRPRHLAPVLASRPRVIVPFQRKFSDEAQARCPSVVASAFGQPSKDNVDTKELEELRASAPAQKNLSFIAFWLQFALSVVSGLILLFSIAFAPRPPGMTPAGDVSKWLTLVGVVLAFVSTFFAHGFLNLAKKVQEGGQVGREWLVNSLLTNNTINLWGIGVTIIGLQASVGTLVAKTLVTSVSTPYAVPQANNALVSLDVFALQASTNTLLCHLLGLIFTNMLLGVVNKRKPVGSSAPPQPPPPPVKPIVG